MELAFAMTACGELPMTQDTSILRSRFDASDDEAEADSDGTLGACGLPRLVDLD